MAQAGRNIWLLIALYFCYEICYGYLGIDGNAILESLVVIFYVACLIGFKFGEIPSSDKTQKAARNIFNILDQRSTLDARDPAVKEDLIRFGRVEIDNVTF